MQKQFAPRVFKLGYIALETPDILRAKDHYAETIGMSETATGHDGERYLSIGYEHHNIVLRHAEQKALGTHHRRRSSPPAAPCQAMVRLRKNCSPPRTMKDTTAIIRPRRKRNCLMILTREVLSNSVPSTEVQSDLRAC